LFSLAPYFSASCSASPVPPPAAAASFSDERPFGDGMVRDLFVPSTSRCICGRISMGIDWSAACNDALASSNRSKKDVIILSCSIVSASLCAVFVISVIGYFCHRRYMNSVDIVERGYWKHYGPFSLFTALGSFASAIAWAFLLKALELSVDATQNEIAHSGEQHYSSFRLKSQSYKYSVVFQTMCKHESSATPPPFITAAPFLHLRAPFSFDFCKQIQSDLYFFASPSCSS